MIIFDADDPDVLNGTYDHEGYKPGERARITKARARQVIIEGSDMVKKKKSTRSRSRTKKPGVSLPMPNMGGMTANVICSHVPACEDSEDCITRAMIDAGVGLHRINEHRPNGGRPTSTEVAPPDVTIGEAMRLAVEELGDVLIDADLAPVQMRELADAYEHVAREQAAFTKKAETAKIAKKSLEGATALLLEKVRLFTHNSSLPLFDHAQAELDIARMTSDPEPDEEGASA